MSMASERNRYDAERDFMQLVGVSGALKGGSWLLTDTPLLLGRGLDCDVRVMDSSVSRRHCQLSIEKDRLRFVDLGSRNPALINGMPAQQEVLQPGDEIALGRELFVVARAGSVDNPAPTPHGETVSLSTKELLGPNGSAVPLDKSNPVRTIHDMTDTIRIGHDFSACATVGELLETLCRWLQKRFRASAFWLARVHSQEDLTFYAVPYPGREASTLPLRDLIRDAARRRESILTHQAAPECRETPPTALFVTPLLFQDTVVAVLAVQAESGGNGFLEADLRFLVLMTQILRPFLQLLEYVQELERDNARLRSRAGESLELVGKSRAIRHVRGQIAQAARTNLSVLITGETGTGKELVARQLHMLSRRGAGPLIVVNCAAIPRDLIEGELFGHEKGAFTGAGRAKPGLIEAAHGGTLFLDEIGDLHPEAQARILRAIETGAFRRVGGNTELSVDTRVVAATNRDIAGAIESGAFRLDLYHRLNGFEITLPPLRERPSDIPLLAEHFLAMFRGDAKGPVTGFAPEALDYLKRRPWPGNVRELRNVVARAVSVATGGLIREREILDERAAKSASGLPLLNLREAERHHIGAVLQDCGNDVRKAAEVLEIGLSTLYKKLSKHGIRA